MSDTRVHSKEIQLQGRYALSLRESAYFMGVSKTVLWEIRKTDPDFPEPIFFRKTPKFLKDDLINWMKSKKPHTDKG